jgi:hypothetical protein
LHSIRSGHPRSQQESSGATSLSWSAFSGLISLPKLRLRGAHAGSQAGDSLMAITPYMRAHPTAWQQPAAPTVGECGPILSSQLPTARIDVFWGISSGAPRVVTCCHSAPVVFEELVALTGVESENAVFKR